MPVRRRTYGGGFLGVGLLLVILLCGWGVRGRFLPPTHQRYHITLPERMVALAISPQGDLLATGGVSGAIYLWSTATGAPQRVLHGHTARINALAFRPDSQHLLSVANDQTLRRWEVDTGKPVTPPDPHLLTMEAFRHTHRWVEAFQSVAWSEDGAWIAAGSNSGRAFLLDATSGTVVALVQDGVVEHRIDFGDILVHHRQQRLVTATIGRVDRPERITLWEIPSGTLIGTHPDPSITADVYGVRDHGRVQFTADGRHLRYVSKDLQAYATWQTSDGTGPTHPTQIDLHQEPAAFTTPSEAVSYAVRVDGRAIATGGGVHWSDAPLYGKRIDGRILVWHIGQPTPIYQLYGHGASTVRMVAFTPDGTALASIGDDQTLRLWDVPPPP